jgi:hypothetical protein
MFCPKCGTGEQTPDSYCRSCGDFLVAANSTSLMTRILGISNPEKQVKFTLTIDLVTAIVSGLLLFFLMGYFDGANAKTGAPTPPIVYLVYVFLGFVSLWQLLSFTVGAAYRKKLTAAKKTAIAKDQSDARGSLPPADVKNVVANSVTEQTTRNLDKVPRRYGD